MGLAAWLFPIFGSHRFGVHNRLSGQSLAVHPVQTIRQEGCCLESRRLAVEGDLLHRRPVIWCFLAMLSTCLGRWSPVEAYLFSGAWNHQTSDGAFSFKLFWLKPSAWPLSYPRRDDATPSMNGSMQPAMRISSRSKMMATSKAITASTTSLMASCRMPAHRGEAGSMPTTIVGGPSTSRPIPSRTMMRRWWLWLFQFQSCWIQRRNTSFSMCQGSRVATFRWGCFGKVFLLSLSITWWNKFPRSPQV